MNDTHSHDVHYCAPKAAREEVVEVASEEISNDDVQKFVCLFVCLYTYTCSRVQTVQSGMICV
jgi:hypothetical protein